MKFYSTKNSANTTTFREALLTGMPVDKGLYMPESIPDLSNIFKQETNHTFQEVALLISSKFIEKSNIAVFFMDILHLFGVWSILVTISCKNPPWQTTNTVSL